MASTRAAAASWRRALACRGALLRARVDRPRLPPSVNLPHRSGGLSVSGGASGLRVTASITGVRGGRPSTSILDVMKKALRVVLLATVSLLIWLLVAGGVGQWNRGLAAAWTIAFPVGLWLLANRRLVLAAVLRFGELRSVPTGDVVAMLIGVALAWPGGRSSLGLSQVGAGVFTAIIALVGFLILSNSRAIEAFASIEGVDFDATPRAARFFDVAFSGLRTPSGVTNLYLAALGVMLAFPAAPSWVPTATVVAVALLHSALDRRAGLRGQTVQNPPGSGERVERR